MKNCGFDYPTGRITVNLAPADIRKEGPLYDLPVLMSVLISSGQLGACLGDSAFLGELSLFGELRPVNGVLPMCLKAKQAGLQKFMFPPKRGRGRVGTGAYSISGSKPYSADRASERPYSPGLPPLPLLLRMTPFPAGFLPGKRTASGQARLGGRGGRRTQHPFDRPSRLREKHAGQKASLHPSRA